ncbi:MAG TPA: chemotaxis protein CheW [Gammaproteobacteria bacterium]|nr:chemotaxis protein CheW [Gammaproteobacteria bacterium]
MAERESGAANDVYSLLLPLSGNRRLLLPNAAIVEVIGHTAIDPVENSPAWQAGSVAWGDRRLPVISFEAADGDDLPPASPRARVAILYNIDESLDDDYLALVVQGHPHLVKVERGLLQQGREEPGVDSPVLCRVRIGTTEAIIPDLDFLARLVAEEQEQE